MLKYIMLCIYSYIYTDDLQLNLDLVVHVINTSKKYILPGLTTKCIEFIKTSLDPDSVCTIFDQILLFEENDLNDFCLNLIMRETDRVLQSEAFLSISRDALSKILDIEACALREVDVFRACMKWAQAKCVQEEKEATNINIRGALGDCITQFRFSEVGDFARDICTTGVFTKDEEYAMLRHLADRKTIPAPIGFYCEARVRPIHQVQITDQIKKTKFENLNFLVTIHNHSQVDINVISLFIGSLDSVFVSDTASIKYNNLKIGVNFCNTQDDKKLELKCNSKLVIKPGAANLQITYRGYGGKTATNTYVHCLHQDEIFFTDERISLQLRSSNRVIPLLGFAYQIGLNRNAVLK